MKGFNVLVSRKRIVWIDIAKAIAIILMIIGHEIKNVWVYTFIFSFHMPLFFILSGFTSSEVCNVDQWKKRVKKLFLNSWILAVIMIILLALQNWIINGGSIIWYQAIRGIFWGSNFYGKNGIWLSSVGVMWFMFAFFWAKVIYDSLQLVIPNKFNGIILGILAYISILLSKYYWLPQAFDIALVAAFFMWVGWFLRKLTTKKNSLIIFGEIALVIFWIVCVANKMHIELSVRYYPLQFVSVIEAISGTIAIIKLSKGIERISLLSKFSFFGKHTLPLLCIHHLDCYWIWWSKYMNSNIEAALVRLSADIIMLMVFLEIKKYIKIGVNGRGNKGK